ncbi:hypothetical protein BRC86_10760 [Halobacteriales archaeon QS_3_64_16]|nr:MAG: hypothetical protein BRC86_10760 [Halobacteriales archaeon QS_3_64_16]
MSSHGAAMLDETGIFGVFAAFTLDSRWGNEGESTGDTRTEIDELLADYEGEALLDTYLMDGASAETDYLLRVHARELQAAQAFVRDFQKTGLGRRSRRTETFVGIIRDLSTHPRPPISTRNSRIGPTKAPTHRAMRSRFRSGKLPDGGPFRKKSDPISYASTSSRR